MLSSSHRDGSLMGDSGTHSTLCEFPANWILDQLFLLFPYPTKMGNFLLVKFKKQFYFRYKQGRMQVIVGEKIEPESFFENIRHLLPPKNGNH